MPNVRGQGTRHLVAGTLDPLVRRIYHKKSPIRIPRRPCPDVISITPLE